MSAPWIDTEALLDFVDELRRTGYNIGASQFIATQDLVLALAARGEDLEDRERLRRMLAAVLCTSPKEQRRFPQQFDRWIEQRAGGASSKRFLGEALASKGSNLESQLSQIETGARRWRWTVLILGTLAALLWMLTR